MLGAPRTPFVFIIIISAATVITLTLCFANFEDSSQ